MRKSVAILLALQALACKSDEPVTVESQQIVVGDLTFDALVAGPEDGALVLLLHGYPQTSHVWRDYLLGLGEAGYFAVAPDQRGYSPGARPSEIDDYAMDLLEDDVRGFADAFGRDTFHLVGHDWGAIMTWTVAARSPERVLSMAALSVPHPDAYTDAQRDPTSCQYEASAYFDALLTPGIEDLLLSDDAAGLRSFYAGLPEESIEAYVSALGTPQALGAATDWYRANIEGRVLVGVGDPLGTNTVDTLFIYSDEDPVLCEGPKEATPALVSAPYTERLLEGVDHWIPERAPETVLELIRDHIDAVDGR